MNKVVQQFQQYAMLRSLVYIIVGIFIILKPQQFTKGIIYLIAAYVAILALTNLYRAYQAKKAVGYYSGEMMIGVVLLIAALAILALAKPLLTILTILLGLIIVLNGALKISQAFQLKKLNQAYWPWIIYGVLMIIGGGFMMFHAIASVMTLFGSLLIIMGVSEAASYFQIKKIK